MDKNWKLNLLLRYGEILQGELKKTFAFFWKVLIYMAYTKNSRGTERGFLRTLRNCPWQYFYSKTNNMHKCIKFILFWNDTLHVSDCLSVHHQQFKTVQTTKQIYHTDTAVCLLVLFNSSCLVAVCTVLNCWWRTERPSETCRMSLQNKLNLIHWYI